MLLLKKIYKLESSDAIIWSGRTDGIFVTLHDIHVILKDVDVANNLIDSFAKILVNEHDAIHPHKSYMLVTSEMEVREDEGTSTGQTPGGISQQVYVSILSNELQWECKDEVPYHWTLLVLDNQYVEWRHYNSLRPRDNRKDPYSVDAKEIVSKLHMTHH